MARSLDVLVPGSTTIVFHLAKVFTEPSVDRLQGWANALAKCDVVFTLLQEDKARTRGPLETSRLAETCRKVVKYPYIATTAFHPDCTYVRCAGEGLRGPMGPYHSALVAACYLLKVPKNRVEKLFNNYYFASVGYTDGADVLISGFVKANRLLGFDFGPFIEQTGGKPFMHTINHPTADIIHEMTILALEKAGVPIGPQGRLSPADELAEGVVWPIYPEVGRKLNINGGYVFQAHISEKLTLSEYVSHAYQSYDGAVELVAPRSRHVERYWPILSWSKSLDLQLMKERYCAGRAKKGVVGVCDL